MTIISPSVGRVVLYHPADGDTHFAVVTDQPCAAIVAYVWNDRMVNLAVFDLNGVALNRTSVPLRQEGDPEPSGSYCEWMEYQLGQAKKYEALAAEKAAAEQEPASADASTSTHASTSAQQEAAA